MFLLKIQDNNLLKQKNDKIEIQTKEILIQNEKLDKQNKNITASINYAKTIQQAILPSKQMMDKYFESFVIYRPKDIVSGDFYWFTTVEQTGKKDLLFLAVADCTGHGVPGAFMSMIGSRLLNEIVNENNILQPSEILCQLNQKLRSALNQENNKNNDGIDIGICQIQNENFNERKIIFAGAKRPLVYYSKNENSMSVVEGDHKSIGGCSEVKSSIHFKDNEVIIRKGDMFYISSDGIIDQNGPDKKRFGTPRLLDNLKMLANYTPDEQKKKLESVMNEFLNNQEQRDDITIIGIKLI
jgi:serine phosphatase RsbU (regulator of sigma subunit)